MPDPHPQGHAERELDKIIYNAKYSTVSGLDSGWTEIYEPYLREQLEQLIQVRVTEAMLRGRLKEVDLALNTQWHIEVVGINNYLEGRKTILDAQLKAQLTEGSK